MKRNKRENIPPAKIQSSDLLLYPKLGSNPFKLQPFLVTKTHGMPFRSCYNVLNFEFNLNLRSLPSRGPTSSSTARICILYSC